MWNFLSRLFGSASKQRTTQLSHKAFDLERDYHQRSEQLTTEKYYSTLYSFEEAFLNHDHEAVRKHISATLREIPAWVEEDVSEYGAFDIQRIPALEKGGTILAVLNDHQGLAEMDRIVSATPELEKWQEIIKQHKEDLELTLKILAVIDRNPGCLQKDMKRLLNVSDGRKPANLLGWLEKAGKISRNRVGKTYELYLAGRSPTKATLPKPTLPKPTPRSHRKDSRRPSLRDIDLNSVPCTSLPRAPHHWEVAQTKQHKRDIEGVKDFFEIRDTTDWALSAVQRLPIEDRPDPAFRRIHPSDSGIFLIDDLGNAELDEQAEAAALHYGRSGQVIAQKGLLHNVYRLTANPLGSSLIAMSKQCVLHAYDNVLSPFLETPLREAPEIQAAIRRFEINESELKNHIRCVGISKGNERYLFTIVDEAWCVGMEGLGLWGVKLPLSEGWERISTPSQICGTTLEIDKALALMDLSFPLTPLEIKKRYWELAKRWHPDLNQGDPQAEERMKSLVAAAEILTGIDVSVLSPPEGQRFVKNQDYSEVAVGGFTVSVSSGMTGGEAQAADWIYAANFAGLDNSVFLAGYSGNVVMIDQGGSPIRAYNIGTVPRRIVDTGDYLYVLTDTRLYVLKGDTLYSVVDVFDAGELLVAQTGFGLLEKKQFRWFLEDGSYQGRIVTKNPIRRVYYRDGMVVETRQRRVIVDGVPTWWEG